MASMVGQMRVIEAKPLLVLLKATSPKAVESILSAVFTHRDGVMPAKYQQVIASTLQLNPKALQLFLNSCTTFVRRALYNSTSVADVLKVLPDSFHPQLGKLLSQIVASKLLSWRQQAKSSQLSLPKLESIDWRADVQTASESLSRMTVPSVFVELKVRDDNVPRGAESKRESICFEMTQDTLSAMLDGLSKIRDQLNSVAAVDS